MAYYTVHIYMVKTVTNNGINVKYIATACHKGKLSKYMSACVTVELGRIIFSRLILHFSL